VNLPGAEVVVPLLSELELTPDKVHVALSFTA
jgi:hypothetical protein